MFNKSGRTLGAKSEEDLLKLRQLRQMQSVALWLLIAMAIVFAVSFGLQDRITAFAYVRAASEGGMVGAIADWFAVTALFRHPLGLKIPHTNLIANKKDDIGEGLGSFIEENFLSDEVVHDKLSTISGARHAGEWLSNRKNADKVGDVTAEVGLAFLTVLDDDDVRELIESIVRRHMINPVWSPTLGRVLSQALAGEHEGTAVDLLADHIAQWLASNPASFDSLVSSRLPSWMPSFASKFVDKKIHAEALKFVETVRQNKNHPLRVTITNMLSDLADDLQNTPSLQAKVEAFKHESFTSPRVRELADAAWRGARSALIEMLENPESDLRIRLVSAIQDAGINLADDPTLQYKIDVWVMGAVKHLVHNYRHDLASIVSDTVKNWDATEAAAKIELQVGKDLQFIRINGTVVGALAGLTIFAIASFAKNFIF